MVNGDLRLGTFDSHHTPMNNKRLLIITKHFHDALDAQAKQSAALIDALSKKGIEIHVITGAPPANPAHSKSANVTHVTVYSLPATWITTKSSLYAKLWRKLTRNISACINTRWVKEAASFADHLIDKHDFDAIITIAMPMESHMVALQMRSKPKWIACFSDPWPESILPKPYSDFSLPFLNALQKRTVYDVLLSSDNVVFTCPEQQYFMRRYYPKLDRRKCKIIAHVATNTPNRKKHAKPKSTFTLIHAGAISRERSCAPLAKALGKLPFDNRIELHLYGVVHDSMLAQLRRYCREEQYKLHGWKSIPELNNAYSSANALLLIEAEMPSYPFLPSKLADYSATSLPIIAITGSSSPSSRLITQHRAGIVVAHDANSIYDALIQIYANRTIFTSEGLYREFEKNAISSKYYDLISSLSM